MRTACQPVNWGGRTYFDIPNKSVQVVLPTPFGECILFQSPFTRLNEKGMLGRFSEVGFLAISRALLLDGRETNVALQHGLGERRHCSYGQ